MKNISRVLDFESAPLFIRIYSPGDPIVGEELTLPTGTNAPDSDICHSLEEGSSKTGKRKGAAPKSDSYGSRRSKRAKPEKDPFKQMVVYVGKGDTVRDLKLKVRSTECHRVHYISDSHPTHDAKASDIAQNLFSLIDHAKDPYCAHLPEAAAWSTGA